MKKISTILLSATFGCLNVCSSDVPLVFNIYEGHNTPVNSGPHKTPPRVEMPSATYDSDAKIIQIEYAEQIDGATYYIKDNNGLLLSGIISFDSEQSVTIEVESLADGEYALEIVKGNYNVITSFSISD